jgi:tetratricopeptide (TPR) repeat protein
MTDGATRDQIALIREELEDLDDQVLSGDLDPHTADALRQKYTAQLEALDERAGDEVSDDGPPEVRSNGRRLSGRALAGWAMVGLAVLGIGLFAVWSLEDRSPNGVEGVAGDIVDGTGGVDLSSITDEQMEEVVAQNPDVIGMRLALARRYFEAGEFDKALDHYFAILDREQNAEALANVGWMTYLSGRPDIAVGYLEAALQRRPDYLPAKWFLANVYVTLGRSDDARVLLVELAASDDVPKEIKDGVGQLLTQIESSP